MRFNEWLAAVDGQPIDVDGNYGPQCWDLWTHYAVNVVGVDPWWRCSTDNGGNVHVSGFACGIWHGFGGNLNPWFTPFVDGPIRGDVAIWEYGSAPAPLSHVAIVLEDRGNTLLCMTQNPGNTHVAEISKSGILGYLRPDNQSVFDNAPAPVVPSAPSAGGATYTVVSGDTLWGIAEKFYNDGSQWPVIYGANVDVIGGNPNLIFPGQTYVIP